MSQLVDGSDGRAGRHRAHRAIRLAAAIGVEAVIGGADAGPQPALGRLEQPARIALACGQLHQLVAGGGIGAKHSLLGIVGGVVAKGQAAVEGFAGRGGDVVAGAPLQALDVPGAGTWLTIAAAEVGELPTAAPHWAVMTLGPRGPTGIDAGAAATLRRYLTDRASLDPFELRTAQAFWACADHCLDGR